MTEPVMHPDEDERDPLWGHCTGCRAWAGEPCNCGDDDYDTAADWHDARHPVWNEGCDECLERANQIEARVRRRTCDGDADTRPEEET